MTLRLLLALAGLWLGVSSGVEAHEVRPAYLELRQTAPGAFAVLWKVPARGDLRLSLHPRFPEGCRIALEPVALQPPAAYAERGTLTCHGGLDGAPIRIDGLQTTVTDVLVRITRASGAVQTVRLTPSAPAFEVVPEPGTLAVLTTYVLLGVEHILLGIDHLLFVLGLLLLVRGKWHLVKTITAFTVAHSITLAAATLGFVHVPQAPVEAAIALSIVFLASELVRRRDGSAGLTERYPWGVAFAFGLLHGLGFAGALTTLGLPQADISLALLGFNVGVELGQLLFIAIVLGAWHGLRLQMRRTPVWAALAAAYVIGTFASLWMFERVAAFWA